jgi:hypothetical protein
VPASSIVASLLRPRNDEQLHRWIKYNLGWDIPRVVACPDRDHVAPFEFLGRAFFNDLPGGSGVYVGGRGSGKTLAMSALHMASSQFLPGTWTIHVGAIERQALRCQAYMEQYFREWPWCDIQDKQLSSTRIMVWLPSPLDPRLLRSKVEMIPGTMRAVSGPRPNRATFDEVEFWKWDVYQQALNMITSRPELGLPGQLLLTSTRQSLWGTMARAVARAEQTGMRTFISCVYETMRRCPTGGPGCKIYDAKDPDTDRPRCMRPDGVLRCQHDGGHVPYEDVIRSFTNSDEEVWATQHECLRPTRHGLVYRRWDPKIHVNAERAEYKPGLEVLLGGDWGYTAPCVIGMYQEDRVGVLARFDEVVATGTEIEDVMDLVASKLKERGARPARMWADGSSPENVMKFHKRFRIPVNAFDKMHGVEPESGARWGGMDAGLAECRRRLRDVSGNTWYYVHPRNTFHIAEFDLYHNQVVGMHPDGQPLYSEHPAKEDDHSMDEWRYVCSGLARRRGGAPAGAFRGPELTPTTRYTFTEAGGPQELRVRDKQF